MNIDQGKQNELAEYFDDKKILDSIKKREKTGFRSWKSYNVCYTFFIQDKEKHAIEDRLEIIYKKLVSDLQLYKTDKKVLIFLGTRNFGSDDAFLAIYPSELGEYKNAYQLCVQFKGGICRAGLYRGSSCKTNHEQENWTNCNNYEEMKNQLNKYKENYISWNEELLNKDYEDYEEESAPTIIGYNKIFYGIPGSGKSWKVEHDELPQGEDRKDNIFRTTFYLDYSNSDFVGQIYPTVNGDTVEYNQIPSPFTKALERAYRYPCKMVYLVIEEINRGNAAAIFGDLFQLLDRLKESYDGRVAGDSEYPISNEFIEGYFKRRNEEIEKYNKEKNANEEDEPLIEFEPQNIFIPHNLTLLATMNTSDQNVFPLDTAFKRRWKKERVVSDWKKTTTRNYKIPGTDIDWEQFAKGINNVILRNSTNSSINEDKCLGSFFADETMLLDGSEDVNTKMEKLTAFVDNVLDYLFNDVTKFDHSVLFVKNMESFEAMYNEILNDDFTSNLDLGKWLNEDVIEEINKVVKEA